MTDARRDMTLSLIHIFKILLLGEGVQYARQLVNAIQQIRKLGLGAPRYKFELKKITHSLDQRIIWEKGHFYEIAIRSAALPYHYLPDVSQLHIQMLTPLRIRRNGNLLEELDFTTIIRNIARRMEMITERYGGWCDQLEIGRILELSEDISVIRQKTEILNMERSVSYTHLMKAVVNNKGKFLPSVFNRKMNHFCHIPNQIIQVKFTFIQFKHTAFNFADVQDFVNKVKQMCAGNRDFLQVILQFIFILQMKLG